MRFITPILLISEKYSVDDTGDQIASSLEKKIFSDKVSVGQSEFYQAHSTGFKPEIKFNIRSIEYLGEQKIKFNNIIYKIIRTYEKEEGITELICSRGIENGNA